LAYFEVMQGLIVQVDDTSKLIAVLCVTGGRNPYRAATDDEPLILADLDFLDPQVVGHDLVVALA
jgi:hypothetical protein